MLDTPKRFVIASSWEAFTSWCRKNGIDPMDRREAKWVNSEFQLNGYRRIAPSRITFLPGWEHLPGARSLQAAVSRIQSKGAQ